MMSSVLDPENSEENFSLTMVEVYYVVFGLLKNLILYSQSFCIPIFR